MRYYRAFSTSTKPRLVKRSPCDGLPSPTHTPRRLPSLADLLAQQSSQKAASQKLPLSRRKRDGQGTFARRSHGQRDVPPLVEPLTHDAVLREFWSRSDGTKGIVDRLMLLQEYADRVVPCHKPYRNIRANSFTKKASGWCWGCYGRQARYCHHVLQVQHGGRNRLNNRVCLCYGCHAVVHPWMRKKAPKETP